MKMYILILDDVPLGHALNSAAHASLACFLDHAGRRDTQAWLATSFKKVTCRVSQEELDLAVQSVGIGGKTTITESSLDNRVTAVAFAPRNSWPEVFKTFKLYR